MIDLLLDLALTGLALLAIYGLGRTLRPLLPLIFWSRSVDLAYALALGLGTLTTLLFALSLVGLLIPPLAWTLLALGLLLTIWHSRQLRGDLLALQVTIRELLAASWFVKIALGLALAFTAMNLLANLAPPVEGDTVHQYLLVPRYWVEAGRYVQPSHIWAATLPGNMMMLSAWALLLRPSYSLATLITGFGMSLFLSLAVYALTRAYWGRIPAVLAAVAISTMPDAHYLAQSAKVDLGWAFFEALSLAAVFRWLDSPQDEHPNRWLILAGICLGWAAGSKNQTLVSLVFLGSWIVLYRAFRREWLAVPRTTLAFGAPTFVAALPYYLYNAIVHRNPFYPVFADLFAAWFGATPSPRSELGTEIFYPWTIPGYLLNAWNMSLGHPPDLGFYLGFIVGPIFLLTIPIGLLLGLLRRERAAWRMLAYAFAFSIAWFLIKQAARHFLPGLILLSAVTGLILWKLYLRQGWPRHVVLTVAALILAWNLIDGLGVLYWNGAYRVALGLETRQEYLQRWHDEVIIPTFPDWETITVLNSQLGPSDRVLSVHATSPLYIEPQLVSGNWGDRDDLQAITDPETLLSKLAAYNIDYVLVYKADRLPLPLFADPTFLAKHAVLIYDGPRTQLYRIGVR